MSSASLLAGMYASEISAKKTGSPLEFKFGVMGAPSKKMAIIIGAVVAVAAVGSGVGFYFWNKKKNT